MKTQFIKHENSMTLIETGPQFETICSRYFEGQWAHSDFYRERIEATGIPLDRPVDLLLHMPVVTKEDYRDSLQNEALHALQSRPFISDYSSGSTDACVLRFSAVAEELAEQEITEAVFRRAGMGAGDRFICLEVGAPEIYDFYFRAARNVGADQTTYLKVTTDFRASFQPIFLLEPSVILTLPSLLVKAWPYIRDFWPHGASPIKSVIHMGEAMHPDLKREIEAVWGCKVYSFYGTTELGGMGGECAQGDGCHFDPSLICPTLENAVEVRPGVFEGEGFFTTLHFRNQSVIKYRAGDIVQIDLNPCSCGEATPRLRFIERTADSFIITGDKFRYETLFNALRKTIPELELMSIHLNDLPDSDGTKLAFWLPAQFASQRAAIENTLRYDIFELDSVFHYGFAELHLKFVEPSEFGERKMKRVVDTRRFFA